jgi:hypothetical protein
MHEMHLLILRSAKVKLCQYEKFQRSLSCSASYLLMMDGVQYELTENWLSIMTIKHGQVCPKFGLIV